MRLLAGPPGSGKSSRLLAEFRAALRHNDSGVRLLVPTATMAEHLRHTLAREDFVFPPSRILTLSQWVQLHSPELAPVSPATLCLITERALVKLSPTEFSGVAQYPGFAAALARGIDEFATSGGSSADLWVALPKLDPAEAPYARAFHAVYHEVEAQLSRRGLALRATRLERAAARIRHDGLGAIHTVGMDGFYTFSRAELDLLNAVGSRAALTVTLPVTSSGNPIRESLLFRGFREEILPRRRPEPATVRFRAATPDREAEEIARSILAEAAAGRPWREIGIVVRNPEAQLAPLGAALDRFGIPARAYFDTPLETHAVARQLSGTLEALLAGWDHAATLAVLEADEPSPGRDRFDFAVRERMPGAGLDGLRRLAGGDPALLGRLDQLATLDSWRDRRETPAQWAARLTSLGTLAGAPPPTAPSREDAFRWRERAAALAAWAQACAESAAALDPERTVALDEFLPALRSALRMTPLRIADRRRNVVHLLSVYEARQWELPVVFVCGLVEKQFPRHFPQDPIFPDNARWDLRRAGISLRTTADLEQEERFLYEFAVTRATERLFLSYAEADIRGGANLPSSFLAADAPAVAAWVRPAPRRAVPPSAAPRLADPALLARLAASSAALSPSALETFLTCPFQFFAGKTLRLDARPAPPAARLDFLVRGNIVHKTLAHAAARPRELEVIFAAEFEAAREREHLQPGYFTELHRRLMLDDLRRFFDRPPLPFTADSWTEKEFDLQLAPELLLRGRIDRIDHLASGDALVIDYKYSAATRVRGLMNDEDKLQGQLYVLAAERSLRLPVAGMVYVSLRGEAKAAGWAVPGAGLAFAQPLERAWLDAAERAAVDAAAAIRAGRIAPAPSDPSDCKVCDYRDVCRFDAAAAAAAPPMPLTEAQLQAVALTDPLLDTCVVAGPGSGKTTVLIERFRRLVESGISPLRILAITFTDKATHQMKERLAAAFAADPAARQQIERAWVSTVHGFCTRLLRENAIAAGLDPEFRVLDEQEALALELEASADALDRFFAERQPQVRALLAALDSPDIARALRDVYEAMRAAGASLDSLRAAVAVDPAAALGEIRERCRAVSSERTALWTAKQRDSFARLLEWIDRFDALEGPPAAAHVACLEAFGKRKGGMKRGSGAHEHVSHLQDELVPRALRECVTVLHAPLRATLLDALAAFDTLHRGRKRQLGVVDFSDLEEMAVALLRSDDAVRRRVRAQFDQVLMDEFQDTNGLQSALLDLIRPPDRFYAVGDINQSIYGFRHADPEVFRAYRAAVEEAGKRVASLRENWRSRPEILRCVAAVANGAAGIEPHRFVPARRRGPKTQPSVEVIRAAAPTGDDAFAIEAGWVARRLRELHAELRFEPEPGLERPAEFRDFAILFRTTTHMQVFARALDREGLPYVVTAGRGFYETEEVADLFHLLRVLANPRDEVSLAAVLRSPLVGATDEEIYALCAPRRRLADAWAELPPDASGPLREFHDRLAEWRRLRDFVPLDRLLLRALDDTGYEAAIPARARTNVEKFLDTVRGMAGRLPLNRIVEELALLRDSDPRERDAQPDDAGDCVRLQTIHSAKGLEFPVVFLPAMQSPGRSESAAIVYSPKLGLGIQWRSPSSGDGVPDTLHEAISAEAKAKRDAEADRLLYVGMTRAEEHLVLSWSGKGEWAGRAAAQLALGAAVGGDAPHVQTATSPDGAPFEVRVLTVAQPPPALPPLEIAATQKRPDFLPRPELLEQYESAAPVTSVALFRQCPRRYYLSRYIGWEGRPAPLLAGDWPEEFDDADALDASKLGTQVHQLLAGQDVPGAAVEARDLAARFRHSELGRRAGSTLYVEREFDFLLALEDLVLRGQIDLWFEEDGRLVLVDYKTDAAPHPEAYALQLQLYALALGRLTGRAPEQAWLCFLRTGEDVAVEVGPARLVEAAAQVRRFRDAHQTMDFPLREGPHCRRCPHFGASCPAVLSSEA